MKLKTSLSLIACLLGLSLVLQGCGGSDSSTGTLNLSITDTPVDGLSSVTVAFTGVDLMGPGGETDHAFASEKTIDLLKLQGNTSTSLLQGVTVNAGAYQWIRLDVDLAHSFVVTTGGQQFPLNVPSGSQTGLKLVSGFTVAQGGVSDFAIDFDLRQSMTQTGSGAGSTYTLKPALRIMDLQQVGSVSGTVAATLSIGGALITATTCNPAVYVYSGTGVTLEGYDVTVSGGTAPLTSAEVTLNATSGQYEYTVGFLAPGSYTLAVTCASADAAGQTSLAFSPPQTVTVSTGSNSTANF